VFAVSGRRFKDTTAEFIDGASSSSCSFTLLEKKKYGLFLKISCDLVLSSK